jgi:hypothetical protein
VQNVRVLRTAGGISLAFASRPKLAIRDRVKMEMSPYDTARARIVYRL